MPRILVVEPVPRAGIDLLAGAHETAVRLHLPRAELLATLTKEQGWDALIVRSQTRVDAELLAAVAPRFSIVGVVGRPVGAMELRHRECARPRQVTQHADHADPTLRPWPRLRIRHSKLRIRPCTSSHS